MQKYKAVEAFEYEGSQVEVGQELELSEASAADLGSKVELVAAPEAAAETTADGADQAAGGVPSEEKQTGEVA